MDRTLWLIECAHQGDKKAREAAVEENMGLVMHVVKRYQGKTTDMEDLIQIGCIGLLKAVDYFDLNMDVRFSSYAVPMILGEIRRYLRDDGMLKVSRSLKNIAYQTSKTREMLTVQLGREPSIEEIADATGVEREEIIMAMEASAELESLQKSVYQSDGNEICLEDKVEDRRDAVSELMNHVLLENMLKVLDPEEKSLIHMRYYEEMTQSQIAAKMQKTQVQISRMEKKDTEENAVMYKGLKNGKDRDRQKIYTEKRDHVATETLYLKIDSNVLVHQKNLTVKDIAQTACANSSVQNKVQTLKLSNLQISKPGRYVKSVLDVLEAIQKEYPSLKIENLGEADFIITYEEEKGKSRLIGYLKTILVSVLSFFGAAFSIMTFNNDVDIRGLFADVYLLFTGQTSDGFTVLELAYSFGLGIGIILFFNHFAGKRIETDPTPMDVQMHTYEQDVNQTIMSNYGVRKQQEKTTGEKR